jgi:Concanavalin A-like lectin/glucanases superfamily
MPITQVLLTATAAAAPPPVTPDGTFFYNGSPLAWGSVGINGNKPVYDGSYAFPDFQTLGQSWGFNGNDNLMTTPISNGFTQIYMNIWFYPYANGRILMTIQNTLGEGLSYHHTALEINANNTVSGKFWANGYITTANTVTLNAWNHIYFRHNGTQALLQLNGGTAVTQNGTWSYPTPLVVGFGTTSVTNNGYSARYNGMLAEFRLNSSSTASNYDSTRSKYEAPQPFIYDDFTIEWWQKAEAIGVNTRPWCIGLLNSASGQVVSLSYEGVGRDFFWINNSYPAQQADRPLKNHYGIGWEHMAIVRKDNVIKLFSNGTSYLTWSGGNQAITATNADLVVGTGEIPNGNFQGWITDLHIIKGYAKYNANFTPPTNPIQSQTGSVFLLPATASGGAFDDVIGYKSATVSNTPTWSTDNPYQFPTQTFTVYGYGGTIIAMNSPYVNNPVVGLKVSDTQGWSDYVTSVDIANHLVFNNSVPNRDPGEVYTIEQAAISAFSNVGNGNVIDFGSGNYWKALEVIKAGWTVSQGGPTLATVTSVQTNLAPNYIRVNVTPNIGAVYGTYTFTPPASSGSIRFDAGDRINYGSSVDFAFDVDGIATGNLTLNLDANNAASYSGTGTTWSDLSVGNFPYTLYGSPYWDNGPPGYFNFSGVGQYATGPNVNLLPSSGYTKMVWFRLNTLNADNNLVSSDAGGHYMFFSGGNRLYAGHSNVPPYQGAGAFGSTATFNIDTWYCATVTYSEANGIRIYINGALDNQTAMIPHTGTGATNIACFGAGGNLLNGKIGRILCYSAELTAGQVLQNFNATRNRYGI